MATLPHMQNIIEKNECHMGEFAHNRIFSILNSTYLSNNNCLMAFLDSIQIFSDFFQRTISLRYGLTKSYAVLDISCRHLAEELGHQFMLADTRNNKEPLWDPILEATSAWFTWKMLVSNDLEKTVLVHLVLEASGDMFFNKAKDLVGKVSNTEYFNHHAEVDKNHVQMVAHSFDNLTPANYHQLFLIQQKGWDMLNAATDRIAQIVLDCHQNQAAPESL